MFAVSAGTVFIVAVCASFPLLIVVAVVVKLWEIRAAGRWPTTTGKVVASRVQSKRNRPDDDAYGFGDTEVSNQPFVEYEYTVAGKKYRCSRVSIAEKIAGTEREAVLARYPVGATVTVFYNPKNPSQALLERTLPFRIMAVGGTAVMAFFIGVPVVGAALYHLSVPWLEERVVHRGTAQVVAVVAEFGLAALVFAAVLEAAVRRASRWPTVPGTVVAAEVESFVNVRNLDSMLDPVRTRYATGVVYVYEVDGHKYAGDRLTLAVRVTATFPMLAARTVAKYPPGRAVTVHYNPLDPGESVLHPRSPLHVVPWLVAAGAFALAWAIATGAL